VLKTLKQWQEELPDNNFVRIHRSSIVNIEHVERIEKKSNTPHMAFLKKHIRNRWKSAGDMQEN